MIRVKYTVCHTEVSRECCQQTSTTDLVDVNWTVTVIYKLRLPPMLLMTPRIPPPAHSRGRGPLRRMDKFSAVK